MSRGRAWRREQQARVHACTFARIRRDGLHSYHYGWTMQRGGMEYTRRNSVSETVTVMARTAEEMEEYWRLRASREANNRHPCNCMWCHGERRRGMGNSAKVLTIKEASALTQGTADIDLVVEDHQPINYAWRRRKAGPSIY